LEKSDDLAKDWGVKKVIEVRVFPLQEKLNLWKFQFVNIKKKSKKQAKQKNKQKSDQENAASVKHSYGEHGLDLIFQNFKKQTQHVSK